MTEQQQWQDQVARALVATALDEGAALLRWLDVGFGSGAAIDAALEAGVERVDGVDPDPANVKAAGERFDRTVVGLRIGETNQLGGYVGPYDVVLSSLAVDVTAEPSAMQSVHDVLSYGSRAWVALREAADKEPAGPGVASREELAEAAALEVEDVPFSVLVVSTEP